MNRYSLGVKVSVELCLQFSPIPVRCRPRLPPGAGPLDAQFARASIVPQAASPEGLPFHIRPACRCDAAECIRPSRFVAIFRDPIPLPPQSRESSPRPLGLLAFL